MSKPIYKITSADVISTIKGWVTFKWVDETGTEVEKKARAAQIKFTDADDSKLRRIGTARHDCSKYERIKSVNNSSSMDCADSVALKLRKLTLDEVYEKASGVLKESVADLKARYKGLNPGMQRMNLGNRIRAMLKSV